MIYGTRDVAAIRSSREPPSLLRRLACFVLRHRWSPYDGRLCLRCFKWKTEATKPG